MSDEDCEGIIDFGDIYACSRDTNRLCGKETDIYHGNLSEGRRLNGNHTPFRGGCCSADRPNTRSSAAVYPT